MEVNTGATGNEATANQASVSTGAAQAGQAGASGAGNTAAATSGGSGSGTAPRATPPDQTAAAAASIVPPEYQPNYKFKANRKEMEFDETFKGLVKDAETEKKIREWHEKYHGFDNLKQQHEEIYGKYSELNGRHTALDQTLTELSHHVQNNDFDSFFDRLKIPKAQIFAWVKKTLDEAALPPEQQQMLQQQRQVQQQNHQLYSEHQRVMNELQNERTSAKVAQLEMGLQQPRVSQFAQDFDAKFGTEGQFKSKVINAAIVHYQVHKQELTPQQAIDQVMQEYAWISQNPAAPEANGGASANSMTPASQQNQKQQMAKPKTTIPAVNGSGASVVKQKPTSIEDLRKIRDSMT